MKKRWSSLGGLNDAKNAASSRNRLWNGSSYVRLAGCMCVCVDAGSKTKEREREREIDNRNTDGRCQCRTDLHWRCVHHCAESGRRRRCCAAAASRLSSSIASTGALVVWVGIFVCALLSLLSCCCRRGNYLRTRHSLPLGSRHLSQVKLMYKVWARQSAKTTVQKHTYKQKPTLSSS